MKIKRLINFKDQFNDKGCELANKADRLLKRLIKQYYDNGYSMRDVEIVIQHCTAYHCTMSIAQRLCDTALPKAK